ncbi:MAG: prohibitin family protein [Candidatus Gracilibacteria bacterium]
MSFKTRAAGIAVLIIVLMIFLSSTFTVINPGERGLKIRLGNINSNILTEGLHWHLPFIERIVKINTRTQKAEYKSASASKDLQTVTTAVALNYHPDQMKVNTLYQNIGIYYEETIIQPAIQESIKSVTAQFTAEELITKRSDVKNKLLLQLADNLKRSWITVEDVNIVDFDFSPEFNTAIEEKQVAEQRTIKATNDLARIKVEAQQKIEQAKAEAESLRLQKQELTPELVQLRAIEKWNGVMPQVTGGNTPLINIK